MDLLLGGVKERDAGEDAKEYKSARVKKREWGILGLTFDACSPRRSSPSAIVDGTLDSGEWDSGKRRLFAAVP